MIHDCCGGQVECSINMWLPGNCNYFPLLLVAFPLKNPIKSWWFYVWRHTIMLKYTTSEGFILSTSFRRTTRISRWETTQSHLSQFSSLCCVFSSSSLEIHLFQKCVELSLYRQRNVRCAPQHEEGHDQVWMRSKWLLEKWWGEMTFTVNHSRIVCTLGIWGEIPAHIAWCCEGRLSPGLMLNPITSDCATPSVLKWMSRAEPIVVLCQWWRVWRWCWYPSRLLQLVWAEHGKFKFEVHKHALRCGLSPWL